jgi:hypothetical protein
MSSEKNQACVEVDRITSQHLTAIEEKISDLKRLATELRRLSRCCQGGGLIADCRIIEALSPSSTPDETLRPRTSRVARRGRILLSAPSLSPGC